MKDCRTSTEDCQGSALYPVLIQNCAHLAHNQLDLAHNQLEYRIDARSQLQRRNGRIHATEQIYEE